MKAERWQQVNDLFQSAAERPPEERAAFLDEACHGDEGLRREVESLLASYERAENFIELPAFEVAPELLTNDKAGALVGELIGHYRIESLIGAGEKQGAKVLVDMKSLLYLSGTELDYKDELMQSGFVFQNPNVKKACGCGASFAVS